MFMSLFKLLFLVHFAIAKPIDDEFLNNLSNGIDSEIPTRNAIYNELPNLTVPDDEREKIQIPSDIHALEADKKNSNSLPWYLANFAQRIELTPQQIFRASLNGMKNALNNFNPNTKPKEESKQLGNLNGLLHVTGPNDSGFYTNRLNEAGFLGGNGWFANKGGILGGPGAILSTGSILTDYPTAY